MKVTIPDQLKADVPLTAWGKILTATPVIMAVISTMLAGLASSEMTRAQYDRSLGAQHQSKAGDQWSFFQAKKLRSALQLNSIEILRETVTVRLFDPASLRSSVESLPAENAKTAILAVIDSEAGKEALTLLQQGKLPLAATLAALDSKVESAIQAVENSASDAEVHSLLAQVADSVLDESLRQSQARAQEFDNANKPVNQSIDKLETQLSGITALAQEHRDFAIARMNFAAMRYDGESRLNQVIANIYELKVRKCNISAERHHSRSQRFFYGMLAAQTGVIIATFAMAARQRNLLWSLAAVAGLIAIILAVYVYLCT